MRYRSPGLHITLHTGTPDRQMELERSSRERLGRVTHRDEHERQHLQRPYSSREDGAQPHRNPTSGAIKARQVPEANRTVEGAALIPRQAEGHNHPSSSKVRTEGNDELIERNAVYKDDRAYAKTRVSDPRSTPEESSRKKKLKAQEELFESRGRELIEQYFALSADPGLVKEFASAAKNQLQSERHVEALVKNYRERYGEDAPAGAALSGADKDYLIKNVPKIQHVPGSVRDDFMRRVYAAKTSEHARSYLPRESRPFRDRKPARDNRRGGRGR
jgi:hypothetical protein